MDGSVAVRQVGVPPSQLELLELDRRHVWHPYSPVPAIGSQLPVVSARGVQLHLADGRELIDGMSSWWCAIHGYRHPVIDAAVHSQIDRVAHVMLGGLTHEPAVQLATRLVEMAPSGLEHVFFADSGSVAVEVAIKMALQARQGRRRLLTVRGGYHGDTFGAMALCDPVDGMHGLFAGALSEHVFAQRPPRELSAEYAEQLQRLVELHADDLAAVILEPVVQGAGGMWFYDPRVVRLLRELCDRHGLLLVLDEIATGFGRTGKLFACEHAGVAPDVMCVGKALTGGYLTLAATLCTREVARAISAGTGGALMHGPTYMGNPTACAAALASLELLGDGRWSDDLVRIERGLAVGLEPARALPGVADVRVMGAIGVVQLASAVNVTAATAAAVKRGVWLRPFRDLVYTMPPYIATDEDVERIATAVIEAAIAGSRG
jgi:adenosylmethionine---8-amino-7-oxononanoate aminotransferase